MSERAKDQALLVGRALQDAPMPGDSEEKCCMCGKTLRVSQAARADVADCAVTTVCMDCGVAIGRVKRPTNTSSGVLLEKGNS